MTRAPARTAALKAWRRTLRRGARGPTRRDGERPRGTPAVAVRRLDVGACSWESRRSTCWIERASSNWATWQAARSGWRAAQPGDVRLGFALDSSEENRRCGHFCRAARALLRTPETM